MDKTSENLINHFRNSQGLGLLIGQSANFLTVVSQIPVLSKANGTVLISGETGSGKELIARAIHYCGDRAPHPFVALNCGLLTDALLVSELFGHERGAFTDAKARQIGLISQSNKGTLFLDEVDTLSSYAQIALLRVIQDRTLRRLGANHEERVDVRFVTATNASLPQLVKSGSFRADLYYRLCVFSVFLPPLRERREDVLILADHFLRKYAPGEQSIPQLSPQARLSLLEYEWPGNVRELENAIIRAIQFSQNGIITAEDLGLGHLKAMGSGASAAVDAQAGSYKALKKQMLADFEREYLTRLMTEHRGNVSRAARAAGKERRDFGKLLRKHQLEPRHFSGNGDSMESSTQNRVLSDPVRTR